MAAWQRLVASRSRSTLLLYHDFQHSSRSSLHSSLKNNKRGINPQRLFPISVQSHPLKWARNATPTGHASCWSFHRWKWGDEVSRLCQIFHFTFLIPFLSSWLLPEAKIPDRPDADFLFLVLMLMLRIDAVYSKNAFIQSLLSKKFDFLSTLLADDAKRPTTPKETPMTILGMLTTNDEWSKRHSANKHTFHPRAGEFFSNEDGELGWRGRTEWNGMPYNFLSFSQNYFHRVISDADADAVRYISYILHATSPSS